MKDQLAHLCLVQSRLCDRLGSPMYAGLLNDVAVDVRGGGPAWDVLQELAGCPEGAYPALRLLGSVHRLVLTGRAPALARHYPSAGGEPGPDLWSTFRAVIEEHKEELRQLVSHPPQTNEVGRSASLLTGYATVASQTGLPLRTLEIGASAGLNLVWDEYRYTSGSWSWGAPESLVCIDGVFDGPAPSLPDVRVVERIGCDLAPIDVTGEDGRLTLSSFVWPDAHARRERLEAAIEVFRSTDPMPRVEQADAATWLDAQLAQTRPGVATVVSHSVVLTYLDEEARYALAELLARYGERASAHAPLAQLGIEADDSGLFEIRLRTWPGGKERLLGTASGHGLPIRWAAT